MNEDDFGEAGSYLSRAVAIINYLQSILDPKFSPELVDQLDALYLTWSQQLTRANVERDVERLSAIRQQIIDMREAWSEVHRITSSGEGDDT